jgi:hypothetical protein
MPYEIKKILEIYIVDEDGNILATIDEQHPAFTAVFGEG